MINLKIVFFILGVLVSILSTSLVYLIFMDCPERNLKEGTELKIPVEGSIMNFIYKDFFKISGDNYETNKPILYFKFDGARIILLNESLSLHIIQPLFILLEKMCEFA